MKIIFIIAHKYIKGHESYLNYYLTNINNFYPESDILIIDNNSLFKNQILEEIKANKNFDFIDNDLESKFELGAYYKGLMWLHENKRINKYEYFVFTQDNFILKKYLDFTSLKNNNIEACSLVSEKNDWEWMQYSNNILTQINMNDDLDKSRLCWCNSFIINQNKIYTIKEILSKIKIKIRKESEASERYMGRILWELNNKKNSDIDGTINELDYYCHTVDIRKETKHFFCKKAQQKNERTVEILN